MLIEIQKQLKKKQTKSPYIPFYHLFLHLDPQCLPVKYNTETLDTAFNSFFFLQPVAFHIDSFNNNTTRIKIGISISILTSAEKWWNYSRREEDKQTRRRH